jgi:hypothetical protein
MAVIHSFFQNGMHRVAVWWQTLPARQQHELLCATAGLVVLPVGFWIFRRLRRPSEEELERRRREHIAAIGRITDGVVVDALSLAGEESYSPTPEVLVYSYQLAGVTYNCAQDVSRLTEKLGSGLWLDQPVQVRYDPRNPGNSVIVAESWSGLWQSLHR